MLALALAFSFGVNRSFDVRSTIDSGHAGLRIFTVLALLRQFEFGGEMY